MISQALARAVDEHLLNPCERSLVRVDALLIEYVLPEEVEVLFRRLCNNERGFSSFVSNSFGTYLPSRLASRKCNLSNSPLDWLHALADAVRLLDAVSVYRLRFVINEIEALKGTAAVARVLQQSQRTLAALSRLNPDLKEDLAWESQFIPMV
jgi:hypothetical protein